MMKWIGLTGGIATGKSTVSRALSLRGIPVVDADVLAREAVRAGSAGFQQVVQAFGPNAVGLNGELDRQFLGAAVFSDPDKRRLLESIIHPRVRALMLTRKAELERQGAPLAFYDVPLLFEKNLAAEFDATVVVACDRPTQLARAMSRDNLSREEAERRLAAQMPIEEKVARADFVIDNNAGLDELEAAITAFLRQLPSHDATDGQ
jgi:dephospho-CoA kinase